ncbi:MAG TPA: GNAT family N-acetyltransferase [Thermoplasmata archaeon]|nr:GNAT family N-acetyltransferase [Thermoplasmata archaeon]
MVSPDAPAPPEWVARYKEKVRTAADAVATIESGNHIFIGSGAAEPQQLVQALVKRAEAVFGAEIVHIMTLGVAPYVEPKWGDNFRHNALFIGPNVRDAVAQGRADYTPIFLSEIPRLFERGRVSIDVALIEVSPPDRHGYCSYGVSTDVVKPATEAAHTVIAEVNAQMPRALGDSFLHVDDIDYLIPVDYPILEATVGVPDEIARVIGKHIASLVEDGSTLQMGIGTIPDSVLYYLKEKKDLGIHTEMFSDGMMHLVEQGVITNMKKTLYKGKVVAAFCMGSKKLYEFVDNNPFIEFHPVSLTNDPFVIAQNDRMVSINSALEVDLTGQVCADSLGAYFYSGIGGQVDFVRGAARSKGGKPIIALPSTASDGKVSRITAQLKPGAGVVTSRGDVHYVVTEWGIAYLHGRTIQERALALISIAHPDFRPDLIREAKRLKFIPEDVPEIGVVYPSQWTTSHTFPGGLRVLFRPIKATDEDLMKDLFYRLSEQTIYQRFFQSLRSMPHRGLVHFVHVDYSNEMAIVGVLEDPQQPEREEIIGVGRYFMNRSTNIAEVSYVVRDDYQRRGIGSFLIRYLARIARNSGVEGFVAEILPDNLAAMKVLHKIGLPVETVIEEGSYRLTVSFHRPAPTTKG